MGISERVAGVDWNGVADQLHDRGYAALPRFLTQSECEACIELYDAPVPYRKTVVMERHGYGQGEYKYFEYPLPDLVQGLRETLYPPLAPIANTWMERLRIDTRFPATLDALRAQCHAQGQCRPTPLLLKYGEGGYNTLHQDLYGEVYFPLQCAVVLNKPGTDYRGGEFVLCQQAPRAQSRARVICPEQGDMIIFTTHSRPVKGASGYRRVNMRHGVSDLHAGVRHTLGIIFHDADS